MLENLRCSKLSILSETNKQKCIMKWKYCWQAIFVSTDSYAVWLFVMNTHLCAQRNTGLIVLHSMAENFPKLHRENYYSSVNANFLAVLPKIILLLNLITFPGSHSYFSRIIFSSETLFPSPIFQAPLLILKSSHSVFFLISKKSCLGWATFATFSQYVIYASKIKNMHLEVPSILLSHSGSIWNSGSTVAYKGECRLH